MFHTVLHLVCMSLLLSIAAVNARRVVRLRYTRYVDKRKNRRERVPPPPPETLDTPAERTRRRLKRTTVKTVTVVQCTVHYHDAETQTEGKEKAEEDDRLACVVCLTAERNTLFECGHLCACEGCAVKLDMCPMCRTRVFELRRVFL